MLSKQVKARHVDRLKGKLSVIGDSRFERLDVAPLMQSRDAAHELCIVIISGLGPQKGSGCNVSNIPEFFAFFF